MKVDDNWRETKVLLEDIESLLGLSPKVSEEYLRVIENLILHRFLEELLDNEKSSGQGDNSYQIELPYLGSLVVHVHKAKVSTDFVPSSSFYRKLKKVVTAHESPLVKQCAKLLGQDLAETFKEEGSLYDE